MVHNGIEYGLMQAYAEGFELMHAAEEFKLDLHQIADLWRNGSVVRSWLLDLAERALADGKTIDEIQPVVADSGEGRWTVQDAIDRAVPLPVITSALYTRFATRDVNAFGPRLLAALRNQFGGHPVLMDDQATHVDPKS
jgi:6-phosphogluconate dehydrogenase